MLTLSTTMGWLLATAKLKYQIYLRRTEDTYVGQSPLGPGSPMGRLVWCWSPYRKQGTSGALSSRWSGPWRIVTFKPPALTLLQSEWLHRQGKPEVQREVVVDKLRLYLEPAGTEEDLEGDKIVVMDGDRDATDPQVNAKELLSRMGFLSCKIPAKQKKKKNKSDLIKTVGEGDWGEESDTEHDKDNRELDLGTEWLDLHEAPQVRDFHNPGSLPLPSGPGEEEEARPIMPSAGPMPGPSARPTTQANLPADIQHRMQGEAPSPTSRDIRQEGDKPPSVSVQSPGAQHACSGDTAGPTRASSKTTGQDNSRQAPVKTPTRITPQTMRSSRLRERQTTIQGGQISSVGEDGSWSRTWGGEGEESSRRRWEQAGSLSQIEQDIWAPQPRFRLLSQLGLRDRHGRGQHTSDSSNTHGRQGVAGSQGLMVEDDLYHHCPSVVYILIVFAITSFCGHLGRKISHWAHKAFNTWTKNLGSTYNQTSDTIGYQSSY